MGLKARKITKMVLKPRKSSHTNPKSHKNGRMSERCRVKDLKLRILKKEALEIPQTLRNGEGKDKNKNLEESR